jgi:hypothetical protein
MMKQNKVANIRHVTWNVIIHALSWEILGFPQEQMGFGTNLIIYFEWHISHAARRKEVGVDEGNFNSQKTTNYPTIAKNQHSFVPIGEDSQGEARKAKTADGTKRRKIEKN